MIIPIDEEKFFDKSQCAFMVKTNLVQSENISI